MPYAIARDGARLYYEVHGQAPFLFLGPSPGSAITQSRISPKAWGAAPYIEALSGDYGVIVMDQMRGVGRSQRLYPPAYTPEVAVGDLLAVADAAGAQRFAWFGFSWGAVIGLQLALRTDRVSALMCGGWPPLDGPYEKVHRLVTRLQRPPLGWIPTMRRSATPLSDFYSVLSRWTGEEQRRQLAGIKCPKLLFIGDKDNGGDVHLADRVRESEKELTALGWEIQWLPNARHQIITKSRRILSVIRPFLDGQRCKGLLS